VVRDRRTGRESSVGLDLTGWCVRHSGHDGGKKLCRARAADLRRSGLSGRRPDDQVGLGHIQPGIEQAGDDPDLPRIADRSATTKDQRAIAHDRALYATSVRPHLS